MNNKYKASLSKKMMLGIIILAISLCVATCFVGYYQYRNTIRKLYNDNGYDIGEIILNQIDTDNITYYTEYWEKDGYYGYLSLYLERVQKASDVKYIYIVVPEESGRMRYVYDSSGMELGSYDPMSKYQDLAMSAYETGEWARDNYMVRKSPKYGYLTSSMLPITNKEGKTVALLFVDVAMEVIDSTLRMFIIRTILISLLFMIVCCIFCYIYMNKTVISPLHVIENCLTEFSGNKETITEQLKEIVSHDELQNLSNTIYSMEKTVIDYIDQVTNITAEKERIGAELNVATQIQADMLPNIFPPFPDRKEFDIYATMTPAKEVGGDFYDFFMIDDNHVGVVMADVSGKGVPAALFMVIAKTLIKNRAQMIEPSKISPSEILEKVNNQLCENNKAEMFVTVWLGILNINTGTIIAANAGHEFPAIKHNGKYELLKDKHGFILAGLENVKYKDYEIKLEKGDALFVYTDGVPEATNCNNELFGTDRMVDALNINPNSDCKSILDSIQNAVDGFVLDAPQFDDLTMLCLEYYGAIENMREITVPAIIDNVEKVVEFVNYELEQKDCSIKAQTQIDVAIDEIFSNIANYAYSGESGNTTVKISFEHDSENNNICKLTFIDNGKPYNPLEKEDPDTSLSAEDREIGGLGIFIVKKTMDDIIYKYSENCNILTLIKKI